MVQKMKHKRLLKYWVLTNRSIGPRPVLYLRYYFNSPQVDLNLPYVLHHVGPMTMHKETYLEMVYLHMDQPHVALWHMKKSYCRSPQVFEWLTCSSSICQLSIILLMAKPFSTFMAYVFILLLLRFGIFFGQEVI